MWKSARFGFVREKNQRGLIWWEMLFFIGWVLVFLKNHQNWPQVSWIENSAKISTMNFLAWRTIEWLTTFSNGCLGSHNDEERSEMRYVMRIARPRESLKFWTHIALPFWEHVCLSVSESLSARLRKSFWFLRFAGLFVSALEESKFWILIVGVVSRSVVKCTGWISWTTGQFGKA